MKTTLWHTAMPLEGSRPMNQKRYHAKLVISSLPDRSRRGGVECARPLSTQSSGHLESGYAVSLGIDRYRQTGRLPIRVATVESEYGVTFLTQGGDRFIG